MECGKVEYGTSARIGMIEDVRAQYGRSFIFDYSYIEPNDNFPHLTQISSNIVGLTKRYQFSYAANQSLQGPFSPPGDFGTTHLLTALTDPDVNVSHVFSYGTGTG
ncbi:MAG TPA: hypothetical protein VIC04_06880, partial [Terriglobia bacterium]